MVCNNDGVIKSAMTILKDNKSDSLEKEMDLKSHLENIGKLNLITNEEQDYIKQKIEQSIKARQN